MWALFSVISGMTGTEAGKFHIMKKIKIDEK